MSHIFAHPRAHTRTLLLYAYTHVYMQRTPTHTTHTRKAFRRPKPALARHSLPCPYLQYPTALLAILFSFLLMFLPPLFSCTDVYSISSTNCILFSSTDSIPSSHLLVFAMNCTKTSRQECRASRTQTCCFHTPTAARSIRSLCQSAHCLLQRERPLLHDTKLNRSCNRIVPPLISCPIDALHVVRK